MKSALTCLRIVIPALLAATFCACIPLHIFPFSAQDTIDKVISLQEPHKWLLWCFDNGQLSNRWEKWRGKQELTEYLRKDFDVASILTVLPRLSMQSGQVLDYVYLMNKETLCGWPVLYARSERATPFGSYASLSNSMPGAEAKGLITNSWSKGYGYYLNNIRTDGSKEGFFQLVVLYVMGDQFFKYQCDWYHDELIICKKSGLNALFKKNDARQGGTRIPDRIRSSAYALSLTPNVIMKDNFVIVTVVIFSEWGGFQRQSYTIRRYPPHSVLDVKNDVLIGYDCGGLL